MFKYQKLIVFIIIASLFIGPIKIVEAAGPNNPEAINVISGQQNPNGTLSVTILKLNGYITALYQQGIFVSHPDYIFHPEETLSKAQMAVISGRLLGERNTIRLNILTVNDFHGALVESDKNPGAAKLAEYLKNEKAKNPEGTLILSAGDMMQGSADSDLLNGVPVIEVMNEIGFDAMTIGNHEFDWGVKTLKERAQQASFPFLTCNIKNKKTGQGLEFTKPYTIIERAGVKIGIIGLTTQETAYKVLSRIISPYDICDPAPTVNTLVSDLRQKGVQIIVAVGHLGDCESKINGDFEGEAATLVKELKGVDVFVNGHTHEKYAGEIDGLAIIQAGYNGRAVGKVELCYSPGEQKVTVSTPTVTELQGLNLIGDTPTKAIIEASNKKISMVKNKVIGRNSLDMPHDRYELSPLGQWFSDVIRRETNADIVFINGGALRTSIPQGDITVGKLWEVLPFNNTVCTMSMTGSQINEVLQHGINNQHGMVQFSGLRVKYNEFLEANNRVLKVTLSDGTPLQADKTYQVVINDFMAEGGDEFTMFRQCPDLINTQELIRNLLIDYIEKVHFIQFEADDRLQKLSTSGLVFHQAA